MVLFDWPSKARQRGREEGREALLKELADAGYISLSDGGKEHAADSETLRNLNIICPHCAGRHNNKED